MSSSNSICRGQLIVHLLDDDDDQPPSTWRFDGTQTVSVGRSGDNDVCIPHPEVSRVHLVLFRNGEQWECSSVGRYGTYLEGRPIRHSVVTNGMILTCTHSGPRLKFAFGPPVQEHPCERPVTELVGELAGGSESAATGLWEEYFERVVSLARSRLHAGLRRAADEEDIAVSVFDSVFGGISAGRFPDLADRNSLWRLLCIVTRRKVIDSVHHERRQKRGGGAVRGESVFGDADEGGGFEQFAADVEAPDFAIHLVEEMDQLFAALGDELRKVAQLRLEGRTLEEIAAEAGCSPRTVQRKLRQVRGLLAADAEPDEADAES